MQAVNELDCKGLKRLLIRLRLLQCNVAAMHLQLLNSMSVWACTT